MPSFTFQSPNISKLHCFNVRHGLAVSGCDGDWRPPRHRSSHCLYAFPEPAVDSGGCRRMPTTMKLARAV